jgi:hypothetical protein
VDHHRRRHRRALTPANFKGTKPVHISKLFDFWYDVIPTITASVVVVAVIVMDAMRRRGDGS